MSGNATNQDLALLVFPVQGVAFVGANPNSDWLPQIFGRR
jgi:nitrate reductase NapE component